MTDGCLNLMILAIFAPMITIEQLKELVERRDALRGHL